MEGWQVTREGAVVITGPIAVGEEVTVTYQVTAKADGEQGDHVLANYVTDPGVVPPVEPAYDPEVEVCTVDPTGDPRLARSADPATGSTVKAGDQVTYALSFENVGEGTAGVSYRDDVAGVLDDATMTSAPVASGASLSVSDGSNGRIDVTGTVAPRETVTVTCTVTVKAQAGRV